jgi:hypothetical protein
MFTRLKDGSGYKFYWEDGAWPGCAGYNDLVFKVALAPVPEPGEWAMMLAGMGLLGVVIRRRRKV